QRPPRAAFAFLADRRLGLHIPPPLRKLRRRRASTHGGMVQAGSFFAELKRRHVYRVAIVYVIAAWVLLQLASIVFPIFGAPDWVLKVFLAVLVFGFPIALILAWAFEMTPGGIRRTEPSHSPDARTAEDTSRVGKQLNRIALIVMALV